MTTWKSNLALKISACILFAVCLTFAGLSLVGICMGYGFLVYGEDTKDIMVSDYASYQASQFAWQSVAGPYHNDRSQLKSLIRDAESDRCNYLFALYEVEEDGTETLVASTLNQEPNQVVFDDIFQFESSEVYGTDDAEWEETISWDQYRVVVGVKEALPNHQDPLYKKVSLANWLAPRERQLILILVVSILLGLVDFVLLCTMAGHRKGRQEITLNWVDKIPLDLYAGAVVLVVCILGLFVGEVFLRTWDVFINSLGAALLVMSAMLVLAVILSLATRVKAGQWWKNTVIYRVGNWCLRTCRKVWELTVRVLRAIPMAIRTCLTVGVLLILLLVLGMNVEYDGFAGLLYFLLSLAVLAAAALAVFQMRQLQKGGQELAAGHFDTKVETKHMYWDFKRHAENLNSIGRGMALAVEQKMRSERLKTELITNVSHDIKTPLTSIVNYVDLLQKPHTEEEGAQYLEVLARQSARLKKLTEDLVEASKASTGNLSVNLVPVNVKETIDQALGEYQERMTAGGLETVVQVPEEMPAVLGDGRLLWRILDNLLNNVCKYALAGTRVYVTAEAVGKNARVSVKNISRQQLNITADELMERFVRGDTARTTEGSGLGLNIAKSLAELQRGSLSLTVDGDLFKAELCLPLAE